MTLQQYSLASKGLTTSISQTASQFLNSTPRSMSKRHQSQQEQREQESRKKLALMNVRNFMAPSHGVAIGIGSGEGSGGATRQSASATSKNFLQARIFARNLKVNTNGLSPANSHSDTRNLSLKRAGLESPHPIFQNLSFDQNSSYGLNTNSKLPQASGIRSQQQQIAKIIVPNMMAAEVDPGTAIGIHTSMKTQIAGQSQMKDMVCSLSQIRQMNETISPRSPRVNRSSDCGMLAASQAIQFTPHLLNNQEANKRLGPQKIANLTASAKGLDLNGRNQRQRQDSAKSANRGGFQTIAQKLKLKSSMQRMSEPLTGLVTVNNDLNQVSSSNQLHINVNKLFELSTCEVDASPIPKNLQHKSYNKNHPQGKQNQTTQLSIQSRRTASARNANLSSRSRGEQEFCQLNARYSHDHSGIIHQSFSSEHEEKQKFVESPPSRNLERIVEAKHSRADGSPRTKIKSCYVVPQGGGAPSESEEITDDNQYDTVNQKNTTEVQVNYSGKQKVHEFKISMIEQFGTQVQLGQRSTRAEFGNNADNFMKNTVSRNCPISSTVVHPSFANTEGNINIGNILVHAQRDELLQNAAQNAYTTTFDHHQQSANNLLLGNKFYQPRLSHQVTMTSADSSMGVKRNSVGLINFRKPVNKLVSDVAQAIGESVRKMQPRSQQRNIQRGMSRRQDYSEEISASSSKFLRRNGPSQCMAHTSQGFRSRKVSALSKNTLLNRIAQITMASQTQIAENNQLKEQLEDLASEQKLQDHIVEESPKLSCTGAMSQTCLLLPSSRMNHHPSSNQQQQSLANSRLQRRVKFGGSLVQLRGTGAKVANAAASSSVTSAGRQQQCSGGSIRLASPSQVRSQKEARTSEVFSSYDDVPIAQLIIPSNNEYSIDLKKTPLSRKVQLVKTNCESATLLQISRKPIIKQQRSNFKSRAASNASNQSLNTTPCTVAKFSTTRNSNNPFDCIGENASLINMPTVNQPQKTTEVISFQLPEYIANSDEITQDNSDSPTVMKQRQDLPVGEPVIATEFDMISPLNLNKQESCPTVYNELDPVAAAAIFSYGHSSIYNVAKLGDASHQNVISYGQSSSPKVPVMSESLMAPVYNQDLFHVQNNLNSTHRSNNPDMKQHTPQQPSIAVDHNQQSALGFDGLRIQGEGKQEPSNAPLPMVSKYSHSKPNRWLKEAILRGNKQRKVARDMVLQQKKPAGNCAKVSIDMRSPRDQENQCTQALNFINHNRHRDGEQHGNLGKISPHRQVKLGIHLMTSPSPIVEANYTQPNVMSKGLATDMTSTTRKSKEEAAQSSRDSVIEVLTISRIAPDERQRRSEIINDDIGAVCQPKYAALTSEPNEEEAIINEIKQMMQDDYRVCVVPQAKMTKSSNSPSKADMQKSKDKVSDPAPRPGSTTITKHNASCGKWNAGAQVEFMVLPTRLHKIGTEYNSQRINARQQNSGAQRMAPSQGKLTKTQISRASSVSRLPCGSESPILHQQRQFKNNNIVSMTLMQSYNSASATNKRQLLNALQVKGEKVGLTTSIDANLFATSASARQSQLMKVVRPCEKVKDPAASETQCRANSAITTEKMRAITDESLLGAQAVMSPVSSSFSKLQKANQSLRKCGLLVEQPLQFPSQQQESAVFYSLSTK